MPVYQIILIVIAATVALAAALVFALALYADRLVFGRRINRNVHLKYFSAQDFGLNVRRLSATFDGVPLFAAVYSKQPEETCSNVVLFCHGMGPGHVAYMTEIARLASFGYAVAAYDSIGCGSSQGKNSRGFYANVQCATAAYIAVRGDAALKGKPVCLVGHSWGAYAALCLTTVVGADSVVALSPFDRPAKMMADSAAPVTGRLMAAICLPAWHAINFFRFGPHGNASATKRILRSGTPAFIAYGGRDGTVLPDNTPATRAKGANVLAVVYKDKGHNVYNTARAQKLVEDINAAFSRLKTPAQRAAYFSSFDFVAATEEDDAVMDEIRFFIDSH